MLSYVRRRHHLHLRRALLRRVRLDGAGRRLGLHLRLRHAGRAVRLDHRLGPGARVRGRLGDGRQRLVGLLPERPAEDRASQSAGGACARPPIVYDAATGDFVATGGIVNLPAVIIVAIVTAVLVKGIQESASFNAVDGGIKVAAVLFVILVGAFYVNPDNWQPFAPYGWTGLSFFGQHVVGQTDAGGSPVGMLAGAAIIFFAYIGFDSVSTHAEEAKNPKRDVPIGIIASLLICTVLYIAVVAVLTGMVQYDQIDIERRRLRRVQAGRACRGPRSSSPSAGVAGITSVLLVMMLSGAARLPGDGPRRPGAARASSATSTRSSARPGRARS